VSNIPNSEDSKFNPVIITKVHNNVSQEIIQITSDRLKIILIDYLAKLEKSKEWQMPLSLMLTIALVLTTTSFKDSLGLPSATWSAIFAISLFLCIGWLMLSLINIGRKMTIEDVLNAVKDKS
jgi:hypothetical protein